MATKFYVDNSNVEDKENTKPSRDMSESNAADDRHANNALRTSLNQKEKSECPQTPGDRIPFSELIANPEEIVGKIFSATPLDRIEWKQGPGSSEPSCSAQSAKRRKKRARSSSPTSLSQVRKSKHFEIDREPLDLESIGQSLRTPKHEDPLSILWTNYAGHKIPEDDNDNALPPLPPLSSSPGTPSALKKDNLRRTASCGIEWPISTTKKRKLHNGDPHGRAKGIFAARKDAIFAKSATNQSRVSMLVDSIHQSLLQKAASEDHGPSSSSPLPERHLELQNSPTKIIPALKPILEERDDAVHDANDAAEPADTHCGSNSSEYGDMDLDLNDPDLLTALERAATQQPLSTTPMVRHKSADSLETSEKSRIVQPLHHEKQINVLPGTRQIPLEIPDEFDNFDDEEDFTTELAELANKMDSQDVSNIDGTREPLRPASALEKGISGPSDDEFNDLSDDDYSNEIWTTIDDQASRVVSAGAGAGNRLLHDSRTIKRYLVNDVIESGYKTSQGRRQVEKILSIKDERYGQMYLVHLRQSWFDTRCSKGCYIHLIGNFDRFGSCVVDDANNMVILHPDHLISATVVADSFSCTRRAALQDRVKATSPAEPPQVYGHLIHEVFGEALRQNSWTSNTLRAIVEKLIPNYIESLYEINKQTEEAIEYVMTKMPELTGWASVFVTGQLDPEATIRDRNGAFVPMAIDKLLELEEHVWSPMYGLKGNIDATIQAQMQLPSEPTPQTLTVPLELKTGKRDSNEMHRAQTALYTLLLSDRYDINVTSGILYYLETSKTFRVEGIRNEIRHMIIQRNELACYVHDKLALPPMIKREHLCKRCYAQTSCFTYHKLVENGDGESSGMKDVFNAAVGHLRDSQRSFFKKWDDLLTKEERDAMKFKRELWTMLSAEREAVGRCFGNVVIEPGSAIENSEAPKINRYTYSFVKHNASPGFSFTESQIVAGEPIVISDERGHFALANGYVLNVRPLRITVAVDRRLQNARTVQPGFDRERNQVFSAIMDVKGGTTLSAEPAHSVTPKLYRIDKDEFANGMATARNNILRIMEKDLWRARELRQLLIENKQPVFKQTATAYTLSGPASQQDLNIDQRNAIEKVMSARDYALVLGMPGTGKTTTIAHIIRALVMQGKSVLLTSYTHTAVDNILLKIKDDRIPVLRLGPTAKVHPDVAKFADLGGVPKKTIAELEASWTKSKVVATTCLGINHAIFNHRKFDYCIVDEASQITLPVCLGPIRLASTFVLVGDHFQLPPLVQNREAQEGGLDVSLFKLLSDAQPSSVVNLEHQYRMAEDIMVLSNTLIYNGRLKCGTQAIATRKMDIPNLSIGLEAHHFTSSNSIRCCDPMRMCVSGSPLCWLSNTLDPLRRTVFVNTDSLTSGHELGAPEVVTGHGTRITNPMEASLTAQMVTTLIRSGVSPKSIGVITFYRSQLALLRSTVKSLAGTSAANDLEMHTADKYQGRDKELILLSCVRSNNNHHVGDLLKDWRRVNVAVTRAKSKLIILGSISTLGASGVPVLEGLCEIVRDKGWVLDLPPSAADMHHFEGMQTQTQTQSLSRLRGGASSEHQSVDAVTENRVPGKRAPLSDINGNAKVGAKKPTKTINGSIDVEKFLDRHPIVRDIVGEAS